MKVQLKTYSAADIERYHQGGMAADEAHALERAALDDPFLADAVDGYIHASTPAADMDVLKSKLHQRTRTVLLWNRPAFIRIAASIILLAGLGWFTLNLATNNNETIARELIVKETKQQPSPQKPSSEINSDSEQKVSADSIMPIREAIQMEDAVANKQIKKKTTVVSPSPIRLQKQEGKLTFSKVHTADTSLTVANTAMRARRINPVAYGRVTDVQNIAVPEARITSSNGSIKTITDAAGNFSVSLPDSGMTFSILAAGFKPMITRIAHSDTTTRIVLQPATTSALYKQTITNAANGRITVIGAEPLRGWEAFNTDADQILKTIQQSNPDTQNQNVTLSFTIDAEGNAETISIDNPVCNSCDSAAVRIIRQATKWKSQSKKAKASVRF